MSDFEHFGHKKKPIDAEEARHGYAIEAKEEELNGFRRNLAAAERDLAKALNSRRKDPEAIKDIREDIATLAELIKTSSEEYNTLVGKRAEYLRGRNRPSSRMPSNRALETKSRSIFDLAKSIAAHEKELAGYLEARSPIDPAHVKEMSDLIDLLKKTRTIKQREYEELLRAQNDYYKNRTVH